MASRRYSYDRRTANGNLPQALGLEGDDVDKTSDVAKRIAEHMSGCVAAVDDHDWLCALAEAEAVRDLADTLESMIRVMRDADK